VETVRILDYLRSAPRFRRFSDEKMARIHEHAEEVHLESVVLSASQGGPAHGFEVRLPVDGPCGQEPLASRNLRAGTSM
jgi:hypothetical protein